MKKVLYLILAFVFAFGTVAYGAGATIKNAGENIITVNGDAPEGATVTVGIINPGYTVEDVVLSGYRALQYYGKTTAGEDGFTIDVRMTDPYDFGGGVYTLVCSTDDTTTVDTFGFYFFEKKVEMIETLNDEGSEGNGEEIYTVYSLDSHELYEYVETETLERLLNLEDEYETDVDKMYEILLENLCVAAYCDSVSSVVKDGILSYTDILGISSESTYEDYLSKLSDKGQKAVNDSVCGKDYDNAGEIRDEFSKQVLLNLITNYDSMGYGHISSIFNKYEEELDSFDFDTNAMDGVKNKNYVYKKLLASEAETLDELNTVYKKAVKDADEEKGSSGGGGGGGSSATVTVPADGAFKPAVSGSQPEGGYIENTSVPFVDMADAEWATESVAYLYRRGIVSGKSKDVFAPYQTVTREEFAKMAVLAFVGNTDGSQCAFTDVSGWSTPYVATAAAKGIITGLTQSLFDPKGNITREQAATIIARSMTSGGFVFEEEKGEFDDDDQISDWAANSVGLLAGEEIVTGRDGYMFYPKDNMTRAEASKLIYEAMKRMGGAN